MRQTNALPAAALCTPQPWLFRSRSVIRGGLMTAAILGLGLLPATAAMAGPDRLLLLLGSRHFSDEEFEEFNPGIFLSWLTPGRDLTLGAFRNSYGDLSVSATAGWRVNPNWTLFAGVAHYRNADQVFRYHAGTLAPIAGVQYLRGNLFVKYVPGVIGAGLAWPLNQTCCAARRARLRRM